MKKFIRKPDTIEVTTWEEFIKYGLEVCTDSADGMPWSFEWHGRAVTHENDEKYLVSNLHKNDAQEKDGPIYCVMTPNTVLIYRETKDGFGDIDLWDLDDYDSIMEAYEEIVPKKKGFFEIMHEMNMDDEKNKTSYLGVCPDLVSADYSAKLSGTKITMGAPGNVIFDLQVGKKMSILLLIDKAKYDEFVKK